MLVDCDDQDEFLTVADTDYDGVTTCDGDCDDQDPLDMLDNDGDGYTHCDMDCDDDDANETPNDADGDGLSTCQGDCDDTDAAVTTIDQDGDGFSDCHVDCDPTNYSIHPAAQELIGDGVDNDCDGVSNTRALSVHSHTHGYGYCVIQESGRANCYHPWSHYPTPSFSSTSSIVAVEVGYSFMCWINGAGTVGCTGQSPPSTMAATEQVQISVGRNHACALDVEGTVSCWGYNNYGQRGPIPSNGNYVKVSAEGDQSCALDASGLVRCWGGFYNTPYISGEYKDIVTPTGNGVCGLRKDNTIICTNWSISISPQNIPSHPYKELEMVYQNICLKRLSDRVRCFSAGIPYSLESETYESINGYASQGIRSDGNAVYFGSNEEVDLDSDGYNIMIDCNDYDDTVGSCP